MCGVDNYIWTEIDCAQVNVLFADNHVNWNDI